jgi:F-type H+-transporting ATPase subunit delta
VIASNVSRRYARALYELGVDSGNLDKLVAELASVAEMLEGSTDLRRTMDNPMVSPDGKKAVLAQISDRLLLGSISKNAVMMLGERRRLILLPEIVQLLKEMTDLRAGVVRAVVTTAIPMSDAYYEKLRLVLEKLTGRKVVLDKETDPTIIAGVVTRIGDRVLDGSIKTRLQSLKNSMLTN